MRPKLLDLGCGAGAVALGYRRAGFDVVGCDIKPQRNFPFPFIQADARDLARLLPHFDAVHASMPCQKWTKMKHAKGAKGDKHPDLIAPVRKMLIASGLPYTLENVVDAPLLEPVILNGFMFGLGATTRDGTRFHLERERAFETNWPLAAPDGWTARAPIIGAYGGHVRNRSAEHGGRGTVDFVGEDKPRLMRECMGLQRAHPMTMAEISEAVPPQYSEFVGRCLIAWMREERPPKSASKRRAAPALGPRNEAAPTPCGDCVRRPIE